MKKKNKKKSKLQPLMMLILIIAAVIVLSSLFSFLDVQSTYYTINGVTKSFSPVTETAKSLLSISGIKYIFTNTVTNFATFTVLTQIIIILIGFGIMEKSGFLKTAVTMLTKKSKRKTVTWIFVFICILSSIIGNISYVIFIPLGALLFLYGKRNPATGIVCAFASLTCGNALNILMTSIDTALFGYTNLALLTVNENYVMSRFCYIIFMIAAIIVVTSVITYVTENITTKNMPRFDFDETTEDDDILITNRRKRGMLFALIASSIYLLFFVYNIIPGLPFSGNLLDNSQVYYIDKLFSPDSFFSSGFVFIVTLLFVILGLFYGLGAKTIKNHEDFCDYLTGSLNNIGGMLILIFFSSILISLVKYSNIDNVIVSWLASIIGNSNFTGLPMVLLLFVVGAIATIFLPSSVSKWVILSSTVVPACMTAGLTPEFTQLIFRLGETTTLNLTPLLAYFIIYYSYLEKYNQNEEKIRIRQSIKYQFPYSILVGFVFVVMIIIWYVIGLPLGPGTYPSL